ncbi:MAG TPA: sodium-dependent bicarbonate transport family permease [Isosphaeraceae bacterium]|nr:sodium-dependent bicarbonate transport family permease [Isosphaeraceae bacterium]
MGFLVPVLGVKLDFPHIIYQGLTIYLLIAIGWHGGEELARLPLSELGQAGGFMLVGFLSNFVVGVTAYMILRTLTKLRRVDAATVAGYYGSDSAGTYATCVGVLMTAKLAFAPYMPVMLAVMEIPGCLVALLLVSLARRQGMDALGNMPGEPGYDPVAKPGATMDLAEEPHTPRDHPTPERRAVGDEAELELGWMDEDGNGGGKPPLFTPELLHEVFLNPGIYLLLAGIAIGFFSGHQGYTKEPDRVFLSLFPGLLCLFLLEMGMTASRKLRDLRRAGWRFIAYGILAPNLYATMGILVAHGYGMLTHQHFELGTYVLFSVLCGAASYIAVPAVQRLAIPEASPTLPLAASLGLTFSYNVTIGIPVYIQIAKLVAEKFPIS